MKNLRNKMKDQKGFTLIEMLIVVAIIAVLISVSIPMVSASLEKAKRATDAANERSAKAAILTEYLTNPAYVANTKMWYDVIDGKLSGTQPAKPYGKCKEHNNMRIVIYVDEDGEVQYGWTSGVLGSSLNATKDMTRVQEGDTATP